MSFDEVIEERDGFVLKIAADEDCPSPRGKHESFCHLLVWENNYNYGDENPNGSICIEDQPWDLLRELAPKLARRAEKIGERMTDDEEAGLDLQRKLVAHWLPRYALMLPVSIHDYGSSGTRIRVGSECYECEDRQNGWAYVSSKEILKNWGGKRITKALRQKAIKLIEGELEEYERWCNGDCWGYVIETAEVEDEDGNIEGGDQVGDSCWGFIGMEYAEEEGKAALTNHIEWEKKKKRKEKRDEIRRNKLSGVRGESKGNSRSGARACVAAG
mgnify:CR=1 FL=1